MKALRWWIAAAAILLAAAGVDLYLPLAHDLREFDPARVAQLETNMWRSYYKHDRLRLFTQLAALLRTQYGFPPLRSHLTAFYAARAAVVFQRGKDRADYEKALPDLLRFYSAIAAASSQKFDVARASRLELEWWIVHRERGVRPPEDLPQSLAALQAELYRLPAEVFAIHAHDRAAAMLLRDDAARRGGPNVQEWLQIGNLLSQSWSAAWKALHTSAIAQSESVP